MIAIGDYESNLEMNQDIHDWYVVGWRFSDELITKEGEEVNQCLVKDLDLDKMLEEEKKWHTEFYHKVKNGETFYKKTYITEDTVEEYIENHINALGCYMFMNEHGEVFCKDDMYEKEWKRNVNEFIQRLKEDESIQEEIITIIDIHN